MEDISRELEREITQLKPSPYKKSRKKSILIVDDFGEMKSAGHLKVLAYFFGVVSLMGLIAVGGFYYFFALQSLENNQLKLKVSKFEKKLDRLITEKEMLMARLVISGKDPGIDTQPESSASPAPGTSEKGKKEGIKKKLDSKSVETVGKTPVEATARKSASVVGKGAVEKNQSLGLDQAVLESKTSGQQKMPEDRIVAIEKFIVTRDGGKGDLLVRFDIRNMSDKSGGVSGRIFTILKPENNSQEGWLVVPSSTLDKGVPTQYKKGQYFSIAHFKPVKFRIENQAGPDYFKKAAIYIFNENGDLMFESLIDITEEEPS